MILADAAAAEKRMRGTAFVEAEKGLRLAVTFAQLFLELEVRYHNILLSLLNPFICTVARLIIIQVHDNPLC